MADARLQNLRDDLGDESFRVAILVGVASVPFTLLFSWGLVFDEVQFAGGRISGGPLFLAGLVVGYLYTERPVDSRRAGALAGFAGSIAVVLLYLFNLLTTVVSATRWVAMGAVLLTPLALGLGVLLCVVVSMIGALTSSPA